MGTNRIAHWRTAKGENTMIVELGYPIFAGMPVYPGLPQVEVTPRERIQNGDPWNGSILSIYLHAGTHADAPWHYLDDAFGIDQIPAENFIYNHPLLVSPDCGPGSLISVQDLQAAGDNLYEADALFFNTGYWRYRKSDFLYYGTNFPTLSPEAAVFIQEKLPKVKAVAIDTLSIENLAQGNSNGYQTHRTLLNPEPGTNRTIVILEDYNPEPVIGRAMKFAVATPLRIQGRDATPINIFAGIS